MRWAGHVAQMGQKRNSYTFGCEKLKGRKNVEDLGVDGVE